MSGLEVTRPIDERYAEVALPFFQWSGPGSGYVATPLNLHYIIINHFCNMYITY